MNPQIIKTRPPNFEAIAARFPRARTSPVIFAYAPNIYAPSCDVPPALYTHECVHIERQLEIGVEVWWDRYLSDDSFRYHEELLAHRAEYQAMIYLNTSRQARRVALKDVAKKLAHALYEYGAAITFEKAKEDLQHE